MIDVYKRQAPLTAKILERTGGELTLSIEPIEEL